MAIPREGNRILRFAALFASAGASLTLIWALIWTDAAAASQGPGVTAATASSLTQVITAILVYGASALVVGSGLIGALRQQ